jgi:hypothetical protein
MDTSGEGPPGLDMVSCQWPVAGDMLRDWHWAVPKSFDLGIFNRFADPVMVRTMARYGVLDTVGGTFKDIADSKSHFADLADDPDTFGNCLSGSRR